MNILVTGGVGLLGNSVVKKLALNKKYRIFILDLKKNKKRFKYKYNNVFFVAGDFKNFSSLKKIIFNKKIKGIFHLGAQTQVLDAINNPYKTFSTNIVGTINILECIRIINKSIILIYSSSDKAYGEAGKKSYTEKTKLNAIYPYDVSKSASDLICQSYSQTYKIKIGIIRCANIFGPYDYNIKRIVPETIMSGLLKKKLIIRSSGKLKREYIFVEDVADAYEKLFKKLLKNKNFLKIYNIGSKINLTVIEMVKKINYLLNNKIEYKIKHSSKQEIMIQKLNYRKAIKELNWKPKTNIYTGLKKTIEWYKNNQKEFQKRFN